MTPTEELGRGAITDMVKRRMTFVYSNEEPILFMRHKLNIRKRIHVVV